LKRNDGKVEPPKLHSSEEEYYSKSENTGDSDKQEDDSDLYDKIKLAEGQKPGGFKHDKDDTGNYFLPEGFNLPVDIYSNLFHHQKEGISWLYSLYRQNKGGVLGDDMGLGKTV
jgi:SNF2 family DNA or RNA helicase